ncbi:MAG: RNase adapter RapZ [Lachnospiraceae bacterium]|nr:RNase adapter RapZ [Lachnospiraceae bacterium]MBR4816646.1 RNase adapter RapZ [Lachnospiraceae bacterium]
MKLLIVTGMSGSGKSKAMKMLEDNGYYCMDNLPIKLFSNFVNMMMQMDDLPKYMAITADARNPHIAEELTGEIEELKKLVEAKILYLDSEDGILLKRYKETRRLHPLMVFDSKLDLQAAIAEERHQLESIRQISDYIIDTSELSTSELREKLLQVVSADADGRMKLNFVAFGYKYGIPSDADLVFDVRCLPNPFYRPELKNLTGMDKEVRDYVMAQPESRALYKRIVDYLECTLPMYEKEGKAQLVVGLGCTGGQHRSLTFAILLSEYFEQQGYVTQKWSRDKNRNVAEIKQREG